MVDPLQYINSFPHSQKRDKFAIQPFCSRPEQHNKSQCFVRDGDVNCGAWSRCFSAAFNIICEENACLELPLQSHSGHSLPMGSMYFSHHPSSPHSALILVVWQNNRPISYSGTAFASLYSRHLSGLFSITNLTEELQFQRLLQGSLRVSLPGFNGYV